MAKVAKFNLIDDTILRQDFSFSLVNEITTGEMFCLEVNEVYVVVLVLKLAS